MNNRQLQPHDGFLVTNVNYFTDFHKQVLTDLYLPIIGTKAYTLYLYLWSITTDKLISMDRYQHTLLINATGESIADLKDSFSKLEGIGLIRTFAKTDVMGPLFLYELSAPLNPERFFKDDILTSYLIEMMGEKTVSKLRDKYTLHVANKEKYKEITTSFNDAFNFQGIVLNQEKNVLSYQAERTPVRSQFDQELFILLMSKNGINDQISHKYLKQFEEIASFYGLNELELANSIVNSGCLRNDQLNTDRISAYINNRISSKNTSQKIPDKNNFEKLSDNEKKIVNLAINLSPLSFLQRLKQNRGGYVSNQESGVLRRFVRRQVFPDEVTNILSYYEITKYSSLNERSLDRVANDWLEKKINSAESALIQIRTYEEEKKHKKQASRKNIYRRTKENPVPDWFNESDENTVKEDQNLAELIKKEEQKRKLLEGKD